MTVTTDNIKYGSTTAITCTMASLASSATAGRSCAAVDNGTNLFDDVLLTVIVKTSASALANDKACYVYLYGDEDGTTFNASSAENVGTDVAVTLDSPTNLKGPFVIACPAVSVTYRGVWSIAQAFGGVMPRKWGFVIQNYTGQALDASVASASYSGITYTNS
jgi:hypothetical protein